MMRGALTRLASLADLSREGGRGEADFPPSRGAGEGVERSETGEGRARQ